MDDLFKCPDCDSNAFRLLKEPDIVECLGCGRTQAYAVSQRQVPSERYSAGVSDRR